MRNGQQTDRTSAASRPGTDVGITERDAFIAASIATTLARKAVCIDCLSSQAMIPRGAAEDLLHSIGLTLRITRENRACGLCAVIRAVYTIG